MIYIKTKQDISKMRKAGMLTKETVDLIKKSIKAGMTTKELDRIAFMHIKEKKAYPSFLNYNGYPASICVSINDEVVHGIPGNRVINDGDIVSVDVGVYYDGFHGDCARTFLVGDVSSEASRLVEVTRKSFYEGLKFAKPGYRMGDISFAIQSFAESNGYSVVTDLTGHGIGRNLHEDPSVPNFGKPGRGIRLVKGMTLAIEPMINQGKFNVFVADNKWTIKTSDGSLSAHYENTVLIKDGEPEILTKAF